MGIRLSQMGAFLAQSAPKTRKIFVFLTPYYFLQNSDNCTLPALESQLPCLLQVGYPTRLRNKGLEIQCHFHTGQSRWGGRLSGGSRGFPSPFISSFGKSKIWPKGKDASSKWQEGEVNGQADQMVLEGRQGEWKELELGNRLELLISVVTRQTTLVGIHQSSTLWPPANISRMCPWHKDSPWDNQLSRHPKILRSAAAFWTAHLDAWVFLPAQSLSSPAISGQFFFL